MRGRLGPAELQEATLDDPEILRLSRGMEIVELPHYTAVSTRQRWADVTLYLGDGRVLESGPRTARGDPEAPLSDQEILAKFHLFADPVLGPRRADQIAALCSEIDGIDCVEPLFSLVYASAEAAKGSSGVNCSD